MSKEKKTPRNSHDEDKIKSNIPRPSHCLWRPLRTLWELFDTYYLAIGMILMMAVGTQWPASGNFLSKIYFSQICLGVCFLLCGLRTTTGELLTAVKSYKAVVWGILTILLVVPITGTQITKTIQFATMREDNVTTSQSTVVGNVTAIGPTEFAFALQVFFTVPASMSGGAILSLLAGGNFSLAILLMAITNFAGVFSVAPMLIWMTDLSSGVNVNRFGNIMIVFALITVLPTIIGKLLRIFNAVAEKIDSCNKGIHYTVITLFLLSTWPEVSRAQVEEKFNNIVSMNILIIVGYSSIMHIMFLLLNWIAGGFLGLALPVKKSVVILGSHKALSFALKVLRFLSTNVGSRRLMSIVCIISYLTLLVLDSIIVCKWATITEDEKDKDKSAASAKYGTLPQDSD